MSETWERVAYARSLTEAKRQFAQWKKRTGSDPAEEDVRLYWGRHLDGKGYAEILLRVRDEAKG